MVPAPVTVLLNSLLYQPMKVLLISHYFTSLSQPYCNPVRNCAALSCVLWQWRWKGCRWPCLTSLPRIPSYCPTRTNKASRLCWNKLIAPTSSVAGRTSKTHSQKHAVILWWWKPHLLVTTLLFKENVRTVRLEVFQYSSKKCSSLCFELNDSIDVSACFSDVSSVKCSPDLF